MLPHAPFVQRLFRAALLGACALLVAAVGSSSPVATARPSAQQTELKLFLPQIFRACIPLTFDELPHQPVNGLTYADITFRFQIDGVDSTDANYNGSGPRDGAYVHDPSLEGNTDGVLTLSFASPTTHLQFDVALSINASLNPGFTVELFDTQGRPTSSLPINTSPLVFFSEGRFIYTGSPIQRAVVTFNTQPDRFALDNLATCVRADTANPAFSLQAGPSQTQPRWLSLGRPSTQ